MLLRYGSVGSLGKSSKSGIWGFFLDGELFP